MPDPILSRTRLLGGCLLALSMLSGCDSGDADSEALRQYAQKAEPANTELAEIYNRSCANCHSRSGTNAPLTGDGESWQELMDDKGMDGLVQSTIEGMGGMPPMGHCSDCNREQFAALIRFMAEPPQGEGAQP